MLGTVRVFQLARALGYKIRDILVLETMETDVEYMILRQEEIIFIEACFIQRWLRNIKGIVVVVRPDTCDGVVCKYRWVLFKVVNHEKLFDTYEEALLEGVNEALKKLRYDSTGI